MGFIEALIEKAKANPKTIILPETEDDRTLHAAAQIQKQNFAPLILLGDPEEVRTRCASLGISEEFQIVNPTTAPWYNDFVQQFYVMRKEKGLTEEQARTAMADKITHGIMMIHQGMADGLVAGACHSTADSLRPALQILKTAPGVPLVSSFFFMDLNSTIYLFSDCGLVENPDAEQLANIALSSAASALAFGMEPKVAMLSYSTKGSAKSPLTEKVIEATRIAQEKAKTMFPPEAGVKIDGELQVDAALVPAVAQSKAPGSPLEGQARILIFPDLNAGNIAYKLVQRLAGADAYGPLLQGIRKPVNDLSRGCSVEDIVGVTAITAVQAQMTS